MQRIDLGEIELWVWGQGGSLHLEATAKYYKQNSTKSELLEVCYHQERAWLTRAQVAKGGQNPRSDSGV